MPRLRRVAAVCLFALGAAVATAEPNTRIGAAEPQWREANLWRQPEGLPQDSVITILQTKDGYIWLGTRAGVSRFDGVRFTTFDDRDKTQLRENEVWALVEGDDGSLWIGIYGGGLSRLLDGRFTVYSMKDGLTDDFVRLLAKDAAGAIWIGMDRGVSRFKDGTLTSFTLKHGLLPGVVRALLPQPDGSIWVATQSGLQRIKDDRIEVVELPGIASRSIGVIEAMCRDRQGAIWIATDDGLLRVADGTTTRYTTAEGLSSNAIRRIHEDPTGRLWIATAAGLDRYRGAAASVPIFANETPASNDLMAIYVDREGSLWVGYRGAGLARYHEAIFSSYTPLDGLPGTEMTAVLQGRSGVSWIGTANGLSVLRQGRFTTLGEANGLPTGAVSSLAEDKQGALWVGTDRGVFRSDAPLVCSERRCDPRFHPMGGDPIFASQARVIFEDRAGVIWIGTDRSGLIRYDAGRVTRLTTANGLPGDAIRALVQGKDGSLWIGTRGGGLDRLKDGVHKKFTEDDGLPNNSIQTLYMDADDTLWIATRQGVSRYKDGRFTNFSVKDGLFWSHVYSFLEDDEGNLRMASGKGVFRVSKKQLDDFADGRAKTIVSSVYGREHGLPSSMAAVGTHPGASKSADGRVWFAIVGGLAVADPKRLPVNEVPPPVHIEQVQIDNRVVDLKAAPEVPPGRDDLVFRYTALSFEATQAVKFKYKLEGSDTDWVDAGTRREAYYTHMPPGRYRFRVIASNNDGVWNERGAEIAFVLAPHFYETGWFYGALALGLVLAGAGTQLRRMRRLQARERDLTVRVDSAMAEVKVLSGLLPICASCKKIRDQSGAWSQMETYIHQHSEAQFSHGICPDCSEKLYPGRAQRLREKAPA